MSENNKVVIISRKGKGLPEMVSGLERAGFQATVTSFAEGKAAVEDLNPRAVVVYDNGNPGVLKLVCDLSVQPCHILVGGYGDELRRCHFMAANNKTVYLRSDLGEFTATEVVTRIQAQTPSDEGKATVIPVEKVLA